MAGLADLGLIETWRRELAPTRLRMQNALRTTIACATAALLTQIFHMDQGFWAIITILVLAPPTVAASMRKAALRLGGTAIGCLLGVAAAALFGQQAPLYVAAMFVVLTITIYLASGTIAPYSFFVTAFTFAIVCYTAVQEPLSAGTTAWARFTEISLGVIVSGASHLLLWPIHADAELRRALADKIRRAIANLEPVRSRIRGEDAAEPNADPPADQRLVSQLDLLDTAAGLHESVYRRRLAWEGVIGLVEALRLATYETGRLASRPDSARGLRDMAADADAAVVELMRRAEEVASAIVDRGAVESATCPPLERLDLAFTRARHEGRTVSWSNAEVSAMAATVEALRSSWALVARLGPMANAAAGFGVAGEALDMPPAAAPPLLPLDHDRLVMAVKGALASTFTLLFGAALHWSLGTPAVATCIVLAATGTLGALVQKSGLRLLGAVIGGLFALGVLLWIIPWAHGPAVFFAIALVFIFPSAWLLAGSDRVNYVGLQAAFAFSIGVLGPLRPSVDLWAPMSRMLGVLAGIIVMSFVAAALWPSYATRKFRSSAAKSFRIVREILIDAIESRPKAPLVTFPRQRRLYDSIAATTRLLGEAEYEDPGEMDLDRTSALELLTNLRLLTRDAILWRQARRTVDGAFPECDTAVALAQVGAAVAARLEAIAAALEHGEAPEPDALSPAAAGTLDAAIARDRAAQRFRGWPTTTVDVLFACVEHARAMSEGLLRTHACAGACAVRIAPAAPVAYASAAS